MIKTVSEFLLKLIEEERKRLNEFGLSHAPTIGAMYEGLTADVLGKAIPKDLDLDVVSGFVTDDSGLLSPQIDCMLVKRSGEKIPYTNSYKWHVQDVIAVFEVKKTLYSKELADSYDTLHAVLESYSRYVQSGNSSQTFDMSAARRAFAETTGILPPTHSEVSSLPFDKEMIYHTLFTEQISPIRIALGYDGFKSEYSLREGLYRFLSKRVMKRGFGAWSFPQLMISGNFSLAKMNGQPYSVPLDKGWWHFLSSTEANPVRLILEYVWTRLARDYSLGGLWGEDLELEEFHHCLKVRAVKRQGVLGWDYEYIKLSKKALRSSDSLFRWEPVAVNREQFVIFNNLCNGQEERISDPDLVSFLKDHGHNVEEFARSLLSTAMVALDGDILHLTTEECVCAILPDGRYVVAENNTGRFTRWFCQYMKSRKAKESQCGNRLQS